MTTTHTLGFPRIGQHRELKFAQESYWSGDKTEQHLQQTGQQIRLVNWQHQSKLDWAPVGDFSFYDQVLDMSLTLGNVPQRFSHLAPESIETYFHIARGQGVANGAQNINNGNFAGEMTKWFNTNYHYIVPEFHKNTDFSLNATRLLEQLAEAKQQNIAAKPVIIGPVTYLALGKEKDGSDKLNLLSRLLPVYEELLNQLADAGAQWVQVDEPILATDLDAEWRHAYEVAYHRLSTTRPKLMLAVYFGSLENNFKMASNLPVAGFHIDAISAPQEVTRWVDCLPSTSVLSIGAIDGRNIWKTDLNTVLNWLEPVKARLQERLWLAPSCSLLHVPVDLNTEENHKNNDLEGQGDKKCALDANKKTISAELKNWLAFAVQKLDELTVLATALDSGRETVAKELAENHTAIQERQQSPKTHKQAVRDFINEQKAILTILEKRSSPFDKRSKVQSDALNLPLYPTTTIGSFPQTKEIRQTRRQFKRQEISVDSYTQTMKAEIARCVAEQEDLGLDVLVHGEAERNDMVEYFGEQLDGYAFSQFGWVQSYGSRCVKPPILFGDIQRLENMTVEWAKYAQSLTEKPMKGMLTGPVTLLNWSFVRDDQPRSDTCLQLAFAIREEVLALEEAGIHIIQIDEAALREGLPLRESQWQSYLDWAVQAFRVTANGVKDSTQIHTHMCYSEFNDIIESIANMDADVVTIETSRSDMELLEVFKDFNYPNDIGPGVYDIHSPNIPSVDQIVNLMHKAAEHIPNSRLWVNPDCGLKTRHWNEVIPSLHNMIHAVNILRSEASEKTLGKVI